MGSPSPALVSVVLQVRCGVTRLLLPAADASERSYPRERPRVPGNTSPAPRAVNSPWGNAVSVLSPSFPHLPVTPMQGLVLSAGTGRSGCNPARAPVPNSPGKLPSALRVPTALSSGSAAGPQRVRIKMVSQVPPPRFALHCPSKAGHCELSARVSNAAHTAQPSPPFPGVSVTTKTLPLAFVSSHIPAQLPLVIRWEGCSGETRQETREFKGRGTNTT